MGVPDRRSAPDGAISRRVFLGGAAAGSVAGGFATWAVTRLLPPYWEPIAPDTTLRQAAITPPQGLVAGRTLGIPGPYPGRVIEVRHAGSVADGKRNREAVQGMIERGMTELVGCDDAVEAWRRFFQPGDRVGIKVVPVGKPDAISSPEVVLEVIEGLKSAGVRASDILIFERYRREFIDAGYLNSIPPEVHWESSSAQYDDAQLEIDGQLARKPGRPAPPREDHVAGYDPEVYRELAFCMPPPDHDPGDDRRFRSHLSRIITERVDKFISIPVLKDHRSAGVTLCLKNLSHGLVNNVCRSHPPKRWKSDQLTGGLNQCQTFIPAMASLPPIREKAVLQIIDGLVGCYEGGPGVWNKTFATWEYGSLLFGTDPVALDHIGWQIIDAKRTEEGWPPVASMGTDGHSGEREDILGGDGKPYPEQFHIRQPQHIALAATLGLGVFDAGQIEHRKIALA